MSAAHTSPTLSLTLQWGDWSNGIQDLPVFFVFFYLGVKTGKLEKKVKSPLPKFRTTYSYNIFLILSHSHSRVVHLWVLPNAMVSPSVRNRVKLLGGSLSETFSWVYRCRPPLMSAAHTSPTLSLTLQWGDWSNGIQDLPVFFVFFYLGVKTGKLEKKVKSPLPKFRTTYSYNIFLILSHSHSRVVHLWVLPNAMVSPSVRNRVKLLGGSLSETFSWVQQRPSARPIIIMLF